MLSEFMAQVKVNGMARTNRYEVEIQWPFGINSSTAQLVQLFCESTQLPGMNVSSSEQRIFGEVRHMPYERTFEDLNLTFYVDAQMRVKKLFDDWQSLVVDPVTRTVGYYKNYTKNITVRALDVTDSIVYEVVLIEAWPKTVGAVTMNADQKDVMRLNVNFQYKSWTSTTYTVPTIDQSTNLPVKGPADVFGAITGKATELFNVFTGR